MAKLQEAESWALSQGERWQKAREVFNPKKQRLGRT